MNTYNDYTRLLIDIDDKGLAIVTNNRPEMRNALDPLPMANSKEYLWRLMKIPEFA